MLQVLWQYWGHQPRIDFEDLFTATGDVWKLFRDVETDAQPKVPRLGLGRDSGKFEENWKLGCVFATNFDNFRHSRRTVAWKEATAELKTFMTQQQRKTTLSRAFSWLRALKWVKHMSLKLFTKNMIPFLSTCICCTRTIPCCRWTSGFSTRRHIRCQ